MSYTKVFTPQYQNGWKNKPDTSTPVIAEALNGYDEALEHIEDYLYDNPPGGIVVQDISSNIFTPEQGITMGDCIARKYGNIIFVERLSFENVVIPASGSLVLASINPTYGPIIQSFTRIMWNIPTLASDKFLEGFISGSTNKISINKRNTSLTAGIQVVGFSYLCV